MNIYRAEIKQSAKDSLKGNWGNAVVAMLLFYAVILGLSILGSVLSFGNEDKLTIGSGVASLLQVVIAGPLALGMSGFFLDFSNGNGKSPSAVFDGFKHFVNAFLVTLLISIFVLLWSILLVIPGIIALLAYSQVFFILAENPEMKPLDAIKKSKEMMKGHKGEFFILELSFIGWIFLVILTFGIGNLWFCPYLETTCANYYKKLKEESSLGNDVEDAQFEVIEESTIEETTHQGPEL